LRVACEALREQYGLPPFWYDCEVEGEDSWAYAHSKGESLGFNITQVVVFVDPSVWTWMWGAPDRANYQIIMYWDSSRVSPERVAGIEADLARLLGSQVVSYPGSEPA
jgi:hypothetical protein